MSFEKPETLLDSIERAVNGLRLRLGYCPPPDEAQWAAACAGLLADAGRSIKTLTDKNKFYEARIKQLEEVLRKSEWCWVSFTDGYCCPDCGALQKRGHHKGCGLQEALTELLLKVMPPDAKDQTDHEQH